MKENKHIIILKRRCSRLTNGNHCPLKRLHEICTQVLVAYSPDNHYCYRADSMLKSLRWSASRCSLSSDPYLATDLIKLGVDVSGSLSLNVQVCNNRAQDGRYKVNMKV
ncbi:hypothetical protein KGM_207604 [Danaus plexippus plexippus]|uniref:Uncharacterized protein n=1 Tax=Danaus plexippus plexippus TaxID=278856 RepID=A0A212EH49_DANPL|nr:hypothetical protein KGM_207604 [Danaus plexippus plexippus]